MHKNRTHKPPSLHPPAKVPLRRLPAAAVQANFGSPDFFLKKKLQFGQKVLFVTPQNLSDLTGNLSITYPWISQFTDLTKQSVNFKDTVAPQQGMKWQ